MKKLGAKQPKAGSKCTFNPQRGRVTVTRKEKGWRLDEHLNENRVTGFLRGPRDEIGNERGWRVGATTKGTLRVPPDSDQGVGLMPKEVVSPQVVANWFANKRKELRRRSQEASEQTTAVAGPASGSQPHTPGQAGTEEATSSGVGSTPSPIMEEAETMDQTEVETRPLDVMALAARLGIAFPQLAAAAATSTADTSSGETPYSQALPIATLASHLLAASQNLTAPFSGGSANTTSGESQTTPATAATEASQLAMASLASQLLPTTTPSSLSLIAPGFQMLNTQLPVLNELCNNEQQQLDTPSEHNLLSMTYDQLHPPATLVLVCIWGVAQHCHSFIHYHQILHCDFLEGSLPLEAADAVIFDIGLFHSLWGIRGCVAEYLDGGFGRLVWCVTHIISLTVSLPFAFVSRPRPCFLWPLLIQQSAYGVGLLILLIAALPRILPQLMEPQAVPVVPISVYICGTMLNFFLLYVYWHWYWHVASLWGSAVKVRFGQVVRNANNRSRRDKPRIPKEDMSFLQPLDVGKLQDSTVIPNGSTMKSTGRGTLSRNDTNVSQVFEEVEAKMNGKLRNLVRASSHHASRSKKKSRSRNFTPSKRNDFK
ncbi:hypothetical protein TELCIR_04259 [Teladorsagia circumcincta]|uniref:Homeobox domain protein n=1 Tax=Teladorsagia circumcincta TaxID=45464 RepID=A0A2G9UU55_TELCI|nr:hypothetical protein TELCIR_04259 [Teladorsagia circumcincta]